MDKIKYPYKIQEVDKEVNEKIKKDFKGLLDGVVQIGPKKYIYHKKMGEFAESLYNFQVRPDDVWVVTLPRSGTTMTQELVWLIVNDDYEKASSVLLRKRFPFFEYFTIVHDDLKQTILHEIGDNKEIKEAFLERTAPVWEDLDKRRERRFIKTHLPLSLLPPSLLSSGCKVIYVARNPKDVAVSTYLHYKSLRMHEFTQDFETFWDYFEKGLAQLSQFWEHIEEGWTKRNEKNLCFLFYEDIVKDFPTSIAKLSKFLEKEMTDEQIQKLSEHMKMENFVKNRQVNGGFSQVLVKKDGAYQLVRKGKVGGWRKHFTADLNARADSWIKKNYESTDLRFPPH